MKYDGLLHPLHQEQKALPPNELNSSQSILENCDFVFQQIRLLPNDALDRFKQATNKCFAPFDISSSDGHLMLWFNTFSVPCLRLGVKRWNTIRSPRITPTDHQSTVESWALLGVFLGPYSPKVPIKIIYC